MGEGRRRGGGRTANRGGKALGGTTVDGEIPVVLSWSDAHGKVLVLQSCRAGECRRRNSLAGQRMHVMALAGTSKYSCSVTVNFPSIKQSVLIERKQLMGFNIRVDGND